MTREQLIEVMAKSAAESHRIRMCYQNKWGDLSEQTKHYWLTTGENVLNALTAAGMVVVPREPTGEMLEAGRKAWKKPRLHVNYNPADELMTCGVIYRAMTEAANG